MGAAVDPAWKGRFQFTALAVKYEDEPIAPSSSQERRKSKRKNRMDTDESDMFQQMLPLSENEYSRGIMEKTTPVRWNGEELDVPTFQRRNLTIDTGKQTTP